MLDKALIKSVENGHSLDKMICGLYPLERNLFVLRGAGVRRVHLSLSPEEERFYSKKINPGLKRLSGMEIIVGDKPEGEYLSIPSNIFMQVHYFSKWGEYFKKEGNIYLPVIRDDQFIIHDKKDIKKAEALCAGTILENTGGYIARNINKRVSIPVSIRVSKTGIHPNLLTIFNFIIGIFSALFLLAGSYFYTVLGGIFFQLASIMDGVDGEVAKFTFKTSDIGSWLDTIADNGTLFLFLGASSYLYYKEFGGISSVAIIALLFTGVIAMIVIMFRYLSRHSESRSLVAYDREFIQKLPQDDFLIVIIRNLKILTKKEFFSFLFLAIALTGRIYLLVPITAIAVQLSSLVLLAVDHKYLCDFNKNNVA